MGRRLALTVLVLAGAGCRREEPPQARYEHALQAQRRGQFVEALALIESALPRAPGEGDAWWRWQLLKAEVLLDRGEAAAARALGLERRSPPAQPAAAARRAKVLGQIAFAGGDLAACERHLVEAARLAAGPGPPALAIEVLYRQGMLQARRKDARAEATLREVALRAGAAREPRWRGSAFLTLGYLALRDQRWKDCLGLLDTAVADLRQAGAEVALAGAYDNLGTCSYRVGNFERSRSLLEQAVAIKERSGLRAGLSTSLGALGALYIQQAEPRRALPHLEKALAIAVADKPEDIALRAVNVALAHIDLKSWDVAERFNDQAAAGARQQADEKTLDRTTLNAGIIAEARGDRPRAERLWRGLIDAPEDRELRWTAQVRLAALYGVEGRHEEAARLFARALEHVEQQWSALTGDQDRLTFARRFVLLFKKYVAWFIGQGRNEEALQAVEGFRAWTLTQRSPGSGPLTAADLRERAQRRNQVLISYWLGDQQSFAWVITGARIEMVRLAPQEQINAAVRRYRTFIENGIEDPRTPGSPGRELGDLVIAPLRSQIGDGTSVVIATEGTLHAIPFGALVVGDGDRLRYWIEDVTVTIAPSLAALPPVAPEPARPGTSAAVLVIGDPTDGGTAFPRLPYVAGEMASLRQRFGPDVILRSGAEARPGAYLEAAPRRFSIVHFAAHAVANRDSPLDSRIVLAGGDLSVRQVMAVPLTADLVSLSSCRGAEARNYSGEGLVGLAWGFLKAGAHNVVAGMWDVPDRSTSELMDRLYRAIAEGVPPAPALRAAQLEMARSKGAWRTPYYWAAFHVYSGPGPQRP